VILQVDWAVMVAFVLVLALVPAGLGLLVEEICTRIDPRLGAGAEIATVAVLAGLALALAVQAVVGYSVVGLAVCGAAGAGIGVLARRHRPVGEWLGYLAIGHVVFAGLFFFASPGGAVVAGSSVDSTPVDGMAEPVPVVLVILDELPTASLLDGTGAIDATTFPGFARLADAGTWYRNTTTVAPNTTLAVPAILTGDLPPAGEPAPVAGEYPDNLFTLFADSHDATSFEQITRMCPGSLCTTSPPVARSTSFRAILDLTPSTYRSILTDTEAGTLVVEAPFDTEAPTRIDEFIDQLDAADGTLEVLHTLFPHGPFLYAGDGTRYNAPYPNRGVFDGVFFDDTAAILARQRHQEQVRVADQKIDAMLTRLIETDRFDDALIVVTADHGIAFRGGEPDRGVGPDNQSSVVWVPLFVKYPGQDGGEIDDRPARTVDILPTIAEVADIEPPWEADGISLLGDARPPEEPVVVADWSLSQVEPIDGHLTHLDGEAGFAEMLDAAPINPEMNGPEGAFALAPMAVDLVDRPVEELTVGSPIDETGIIEERYADLSWDGTERAPFYVSGSIPRPPFEPVAFALNGNVVAVAPTSIFQGFEQTAWWTLLPSDRFEVGTNELELFLVEDGPEPVLRPVPLEPG
jgi:hypothetical protein